MTKLEAKLKLLQPQYWKEQGRRVGYQSANPLPPTQADLRRAREEAEAEAAERASDSDSDSMPVGLRSSTLFGEREVGGRKRRLP